MTSYMSFFGVSSEWTSLLRYGKNQKKASYE